MSRQHSYKLPYAITIIVILILSLVVIGTLYKKVLQKEKQVANLSHDVDDLKTRVDSFHFVESMRSMTQVTAFTASHHKMFSDGTPVAAAISPKLERAGFSLGKLLFLRDKRTGGVIPIRIKSRTDQSETRAVVDLLFSDSREARLWGRKSFELISIRERMVE